MRGRETHTSDAAPPEAGPPRGLRRVLRSRAAWLLALCALAGMGVGVAALVGALTSPAPTVAPTVAPTLTTPTETMRPPPSTPAAPEAPPGKVDVAASFEHGSGSAFAALECADPAKQFDIVTSPVRSGRRAARFSQATGDVWANGTTRCLGRILTGESTGQEHWYGLSVYVATPIDSSLIWELHQGQELYGSGGCAIAPLALVARHGEMVFRIATGDCVSGGPTHWEPNITIGGVSPLETGVWMDFVIHVKFAEDPTGVVEVWARKQGEDWPATPQISRTGIPTTLYNSATDVHDDPLYTEMGIYANWSPFSGSETVYLDDYKRGTSFAAVAPQ